jgi:hypothetical protein
LPSSNLCGETWRPFEINELDEMERIQSLKHRENLIKGMGITDFVNRILHGTPGTVATIPPNLTNKNVLIAQNNNNNNNNNNMIQQHNHHNHHHHHQQHTNEDINNQLTNGAAINSKLEIKTKNYNPFENHSLFAEVIFSFFFLLIYSF